MRTFYVDTVPGGQQACIQCNQFETGDTWRFQLFYGGGRYDIPAGATVKITGTKADKAAFAVAATVDSNEVVVAVTEQITAAAGRCIAELLIESNGAAIYSANFVIMVEPAAVQGELSTSTVPLSITDANGNVYVQSDLDVAAEALLERTAEDQYQQDLAAGVAKRVVEEYTGSTLAGSNQSVKSAIDALKAAVGSPLVASTAAAMTDTTKVYVYTGSESGYTSGNWYYYNGSAWVSGGVYNAVAVATDATLSESGVPADAKACGAVLADVLAAQNDYSYLLGYGSFVRGTLYNGSLRTNVTYRITTTNILQFDYDITLNVSSTFKFGAHLFVNGTFSQDTGWHTSAYDIPAGTQFKPVIARRTENTSETADISEFVKQVTFQTEAQKKPAVFDAYIEKHKYKAVSALSEQLFVQGALGDSGEDSSYGANARAKTDLLFAVNDIAVYADVTSYPNARAYVHYFDDSNTWVSSSGWQTQTIIPKGSIFRLLLTKVYTSTAAVSVSDIYTCFRIFANNKINNIRPCTIVSHQGNVNSTDNNCKSAGYVAAGLAGFDYAECDVKFTSDDVPVCAHSGSFTDATTGDTVRIESYTYEELQAFDYYGGTVASLDEIVSICKKYGMGVYLDQYQADWSDARYNAIFEVINKYRYARLCKHIVYDATSAGKILSRDKTAWIVCGQLYSETSPDSSIDLADSVVTDYNKVDVMFASQYAASVIETVAKSIDPRYGIAVYTLDTPSNKLSYSPFITTIITNGDSHIYT